MFVKIKSGYYGFVDKDGIIRPKSKNDSPFRIHDSEGQRLVASGIAECCEPDSFGAITEQFAEDIPYAKSEPEIPEYNAFMTVSELTAIAKEYGVDFPERAKKTEIIKALDDYFSDAPELSAKEPE